VAAARTYALRGLAIRRAVCAELHGDTAISHHLVGILLQEAGELEQAHTHLQAALAIRLATVGEDHVETADTLANIGELLWVEHRLDEAVSVLERTLAICARAGETGGDAVGPVQALVAEVANTLALCLLAQGQERGRARRLLAQALRIRRRQFGEEHPYTALVYVNLGYWYQEQGAWEAAARYYAHGLAIRRRTLGETHAATARTRYLLGRLYRRQARWAEARQELDAALAALLDAPFEQMGQIGQESSLAASCLHELGAVLLAQGDLARARRCLEQALSVRQRIYRADHPQVIETQQTLGRVRGVGAGS
jgi:tetratricopeptide (TPR) repeat protein